MKISIFLVFNCILIATAIPLNNDFLTGQETNEIQLIEKVNLGQLVGNLSIICPYLRNTFDEVLDFINVHGLLYQIKKYKNKTPIQYIRQALIQVRKYSHYVKQGIVDKKQLEKQRKREKVFRDLINETGQLYKKLKEKGNKNGTIDIGFFRDLDIRIADVLHRNLIVNETLSERIIHKEKQVIEFYRKQL